MFQTLKNFKFFILILIIMFFNESCLTTVKRGDWHSYGISASFSALPLNNRYGLSITGETGILDIQGKGGIKAGMTLQLLKKSIYRDSILYYAPRMYMFNHLTFSIKTSMDSYMGISLDMALLQPFRTEFIMEKEFRRGSLIFKLGTGYMGTETELKRYGETSLIYIMRKGYGLFIGVASRSYPDSDVEPWELLVFGGIGWQGRLRF